MSKISYCSLEEAWGDSYIKNNNKDNNKDNNVFVNKNDSSNNNFANSHNSVNDSRTNYIDEKSIKNMQNNRISNRDRYETLNENSEIERKSVIKNMNNIERNIKTENNQMVEYNKFRFSPWNKVEENDDKQEYTPFEDSIEKKYLKDKLNFLEKELKKYKYIIDKSESNDTIEKFSNENDSNNNKSNNSNKGNDIIDLILLIIIGLIVIFVLNSIFNIGKSIGAKNK